MRPPTPTVPHFKVLSWNVASLRAALKKVETLNFSVRTLNLYLPPSTCTTPSICTIPLNLYLSLNMYQPLNLYHSLSTCTCTTPSLPVPVPLPLYLYHFLSTCTTSSLHVPLPRNLYHSPSTCTTPLNLYHPLLPSLIQRKQPERHPLCRLSFFIL